MSRNRFGIVLGAALLGGCGDDSVLPVQVPDASLPGVYSGTFPCDGCPGIPTRLWLRADGRFFFEQTYPANDERAAMTVYSLGLWSRSVGDRMIELGDSGPRRSFTPTDAGTLLMQTDSNLEHRLTRDPAAPAFTASIRMGGMVQLSDGRASFAECRTGLVAPISKGRELTRLLHQYRSTSARGVPAFVEIEGRFSWSADGSVYSVTIERFVTVKPGRAC